MAWISQQEAAAALGVSASAIRGRINRGSLVARRDAETGVREVWVGDDAPPHEDAGEANAINGTPIAWSWLRYHHTSDRYNYAVPGRVPRNIQGNDVRMIASCLIDFEQAQRILEHSGAPAAKPTPPPALRVPDLALVIALDDVHIGDESDYEHHKQTIVGHVDQLIRRAGPVDTIQIAFGDLSTVDTYQRTTTKGTQLHPAGSAYEIFEHCCDLTQRVIARCLESAQRVVWVAKHGNHDLLQSHSIMIVGRAWWRDEPRVDVRVSHSTVNVFEWGRCLIAHHHGHWRRMGDLPGQVARDFAEVWGRTTDRYVITGHRHHMETIAKDLPGACVLQVRSSAPPSEYEANLGFGSMRGTTAMLFHREHGLIAQLFARS